jgi:hypothetical protein
MLGSNGGTSGIELKWCDISVCVCGGVPIGLKCHGIVPTTLTATGRADDLDAM